MKFIIIISICFLLLLNLFTAKIKRRSSLTSLTSHTSLTSYKLKASNKWQADTLAQNERIDSANKKYFAVMQDDGNFVVYSTSPQNGKDKNNPIWDSGSFKIEPKAAPYKLIMQNDGNAVIYDSNKKVLWASNTDKKGTAPYNFIMQDDGNLVLYDSKKSPIWNSNTMGKQK